MIGARLPCRTSAGLRRINKADTAYNKQRNPKVFLLNHSTRDSYTKSCQVAPLLAVGRNGILVRGFGGQIPPTEQTASFEGQVEAERAMSAECPPALKAPPLAAGGFSSRGGGGGGGGVEFFHASLEAVPCPQKHA